MTIEIRTLLALTLTLGTYLVGDWLYQRSGKVLVLNPVLVSISSLIVMLLLLDWDYATYQQDTAFIHFLLGPATVALAVPLYQQTELIKQMALPIIVVCLVGALVAAGSAAILTTLWTGDSLLSLSILSKSVTTPIALSIAELVGGSASLTASMVLLTGLMGCLLIPLTLRLLQVKDDRVKGLVMGVTSHGIGTAQAFETSVTCGAFAGLAMTVTGIISAFLLPLGSVSEWILWLNGR